MALVLPKATPPRRVAAIIRKARITRRFLIFIGEIEVYVPGEWEERLQLEVRWDPWIQVIRDIRKLKWMRDHESRARTSYHRYKAQRALRRLDGSVVRLEALAKEAQEKVGFQKKASSGSRVSHFLSRVMPSPEFSEALNSWLLELLPQEDGGHLDPDPRWSPLRFALLTHERLAYRAYLRELQQTLEPEDEWLGVLNRELRPTDPIPEAQLRLGARQRAHLEERWLSGFDLPEALEEERNLYRSRVIRVAEPGLFDWLRAVYPDLAAKGFADFVLEERRSPLPGREPKIDLISFIGPETPRFGSDHLSGLMTRLKKRTGRNFHLEMNPENPQGVLLLPYRALFKEEQAQIDHALELGLPAVVGFDDRLAERVLEAASGSGHQFSEPFRSRFIEVFASEEKLAKFNPPRTETYAWQVSALLPVEF